MRSTRCPWTLGRLPLLPEIFDERQRPHRVVVGGIRFAYWRSVTSPQPSANRYVAIRPNGGLIRLSRAKNLATLYRG
jgi:hypothetical protein